MTLYVCGACAPGKQVRPFVTLVGNKVQLDCPECGAHTQVEIGGAVEKTVADLEDLTPGAPVPDWADALIETDDGEIVGYVAKGEGPKLDEEE